MLIQKLMNLPLLVFFLSLAILWAAAQAGLRLQTKSRKLESDERDDFGLILGATLTLLGLILGFSFSMAINRYDLRKSYEEAEANAIGTEYVRLDLLPSSDGAALRPMLQTYLDRRISFYESHTTEELRSLAAATTQMQNALWSAVERPALAHPTPIAALAVSGMNDVLNSQGYTQAAWWNRIPIEAWALMFAIAICANLCLGFYVRRVAKLGVLLLVLPLIISIAFCLIADIDSPRGGFVRVLPQNLMSLSHSLRP